MVHRLIWRSLALVLLASAVWVGAASAAMQPWSDVSPSSIPSTGERWIAPDSYRALALDVPALEDFLAAVPLEGTDAASAGRAEISLPLPDGSLGRFSIVESPVMAPELQARYPEIRTYAGYGLDDPSAHVRLDLTPHGFHAQIRSANGSIYIDPYQQNDTVHYQSYLKSDLRSHSMLEGCTVIDEDGMSEEIHRLMGGAQGRSGANLRTYRTAIAATGEYTTFHGGTVPLGLAAVVTALNRVDGVYEDEVAVRMVLVANNDLLIYTNGNTDPYTNNDGYTMLGQNQANIDAVIGSANYDIGHVFSTGGGGIAGLGVVCRAGNKARGVTGLFAPIGDAFYIDYVAHEMGHQYGSNHCFNGNAGACGGGNRYGPTAYEPGSGSTIMAYAGICGSQNLQLHSDAYFVWISLQEIVTYTTVGAGSVCPVTTPAGVIEPVADAGPGGYTIPISTPFTLTGSATTTGTASYCWEEADLGPAGHPNTPTGNAPIFRSFFATDSPQRTFPKLSDLLNNSQTIGEILPSYARTLNFRLTVRDVQPGGVGVNTDAMTASITVDSHGPFRVTYPNDVVNWTGGNQETITWDVAGTNAAPINCQTVNILLSTDGGTTWPTAIVSGTPNDGSEAITVPNVDAPTARIKVEAADNIFFDISNRNFVIEPTPAGVEPLAAAAGLTLYANHPNPFNPETTIGFEIPQTADVALRVYDPAGRLVRTLLEGRMPAGRHQSLWDGRDDHGRAVTTGVYLYRLSAIGRTLTGRMTIVR